MWTITLRRPRWLMASTISRRPARRPAEELVEEGNQRGDAFEREALGAEIARLHDLLEDVGAHQQIENARGRPVRGPIPGAPGSRGGARGREYA